jgi:hypothetical protein
MQIHSTKPVTEEQAEIFLATLARRSADKFVEALNVKPFQDAARGKMFGIILVAGDENDVGNLIYQAWLEIFAQRQRKAAAAAVNQQFRDELIQALVTAQLAPTFRGWMEEVIADDDNETQKKFCQQLKDRNLDFTLVIHPTDPAHREHMERFRDKKL